MGPVTYVIAILGCADGSAQCAQVATGPARYESLGACSAAAPAALVANSDLDFPTLRAECRSAADPAAATLDPGASTPGDVRRG